jgi:RND superfamily putative drug exporter
MMFVNLTFFRSLSLGGIMVVSISVLVANTLLLALLSILGTRINSLQLLPTSWRRQGTSRFWERVAYGVMKRPVLLVAVVGCGLLAMMSPLGYMQLGVPNAEVLPPGYGSRFGSDLMKKPYNPRELNPIQIRVHTVSEVWEEPSITQVRSYAARITGTPGVEKVQSYVSALGTKSNAELAALFKQTEARKQIESLKLAKDHTVLLVVVPKKDPDDPVTDDLVRSLRKLDAGKLDVLVTGGPLTDWISSNVFKNGFQKCSLSSWELPISFCFLLSVRFCCP